MKTPLLIVTSSWPRSGDEIAGTFVRTDALMRARDGSSVVIAAPSGPGIAHTGRGIRVVELPHRGLFGTPGAMLRAIEDPFRIAGIVPFARSLGALMQAMIAEGRRSGKSELSIVAHWLLPAGLLVEALLPRDVTLDLELIAHGADVRLLEAIPGPIAQKIVERFSRRATTVRVVSQGLRERLVAIAPSIAEKIFVAPMSLATDDPKVRLRIREQGRVLAGLGPRPLHVVASRLIASKRIERAIDHVAHIGGRLVLVGDGPMREELSARAQRRGVDAHFVGARPHEEALAWIAAADVVLAPLAKGEGAPTVLREAESLGRPVVRFA